MKISEKYPDSYFNHWIAMLSTTNSRLDKKGIKEHIEMYKIIEGEDEFNELKKEVKEIINNGDLVNFLEVAMDYGLKDIQNNDLIIMTELIASQ